MVNKTEKQSVINIEVIENKELKLDTLIAKYLIIKSNKTKKIIKGKRDSSR